MRHRGEPTTRRLKHSLSNEASKFDGEALSGDLLALDSQYQLDAPYVTLINKGVERDDASFFLAFFRGSGLMWRSGYPDRFYGFNRGGLLLEVHSDAAVFLFL